MNLVSCCSIIMISVGIVQVKEYSIPHKKVTDLFTRQHFELGVSAEVL